MLASRQEVQKQSLKNTKSSPRTCWARTQSHWRLYLNDERNCFVLFNQLLRGVVGGDAGSGGGVVAGGGGFWRGSCVDKATHDVIYNSFR